MSKNINEVLFSRTKPANKLTIIEGLSDSELLSVTKDTIVRIVKEVGHNHYKSRDKGVRFANDGNKWNSTIESIDIIKGKVYVDFYIQMDSTDTNDSDTLDNFLRRGEYRGVVYESDMYGTKFPHYYRYYDKDKAGVIRDLLKCYVERKYKDALAKAREEQAA
jgi:hypothetical protein